MDLSLHVAGPYVDSVQRCSRCGFVILDDRAVDGRIEMTRVFPGNIYVSQVECIDGGMPREMGQVEYTCREGGLINNCPIHGEGFGNGRRNDGFKAGNAVLVGLGFKTLVADPQAPDLPPPCEQQAAAVCGRERTDLDLAAVKRALESMRPDRSFAGPLAIQDTRKSGVDHDEGDD